MNRLKGINQLLINHQSVIKKSLKKIINQSSIQHLSIINRSSISYQSIINQSLVNYHSIRNQSLINHQSLPYCRWAKNFNTQESSVFFLLIHYLRYRRLKQSGSNHSDSLRSGSSKKTQGQMHSKWEKKRKKK